MSFKIPRKETHSSVLELDTGKSGWPRWLCIHDEIWEGGAFAQLCQVKIIWITSKQTAYPPWRFQLHLLSVALNDDCNKSIYSYPKPNRRGYHFSLNAERFYFRDKLKSFVFQIAHYKHHLEHFLIQFCTTNSFFKLVRWLLAIN